MAASRTASTRMAASTIRTATLRCASACGRTAEESIELGIVELNAVEQRVEGARVGGKVDARLGRIEGGEQPAHADQAIERRRRIDPAPRQAGREPDLVLGDGTHLVPARLGLHALEEGAIEGDDGVGLPADDLLQGSI